MLVKNLTFQMHEECMHWAHTHLVQQLHPRWPLHTRVPTQLQQSMLPSLQASSTALSQPAGKKDAQAAVEVGLTSGTHGHSRELPVSPRDSEEVMRRLPRKAPGSQSAFCHPYSSLSSFPGEHKPVCGGGWFSDRPCYQVVTIVTSKMMSRTIVLAEQ